MKKVFFFLFVSIFTSLLVTGTVLADDHPFVIDGNEVVNKETGERYSQGMEISNGETNPISIEALYNGLVESYNYEETNDTYQFEPSSDMGIQSTPWYRYRQTDTRMIHGSEKKASGDINCNVAGGCTRSVTFSTSQSESFGVGVDIGARGTVRTNASFTWHTTASVQDTSSFNLNAGDKGYIAFIPYINRTTGDLTKYNSQYSTSPAWTKRVHGFSPRKTGFGQLDGLVFFKRI